MAIEMAVETHINCEAEGALRSPLEELKKYRSAKPGIRGSAGPQIRRSDGWD